MDDRESVYTEIGFTVVRVKFQKFRGCQEIKEMCRASKDGKDHFIRKDLGWYTRIMEIQDSIPHMAKFYTPQNGYILSEIAPGELIWNLDYVPHIDRIEKQLGEFARGAKACGLVHGDIRPWNVVQDNQGDIKVIDWNLSRFGESNVDIEDVRKLGCTLRGETGFHQAWGWGPSEYAKWCRP
jgi:hypothetical protein